jgi:hypothetical protein
MTIKELIEELQRYPLDTVVQVEGEDGSGDSFSWDLLDTVEVYTSLEDDGSYEDTREDLMADYGLDDSDVIKVVQIRRMS